jgi:hypothetical protein
VSAKMMMMRKSRSGERAREKEIKILLAKAAHFIILIIAHCPFYSLCFLSLKMSEKTQEKSS